MNGWKIFGPIFGPIWQPELWEPIQYNGKKRIGQRLVVHHPGLYLTSSADWTSFPQMSLVWDIWNSSGHKLLLFHSDNDDDGLIFVTWCCKQFVRSVSAASMRPSSRLTAPPPAFLPFVNTASLPIIKDECMLMHIFRASGKCAKMFLEFKNAKFKV